MTTPLLEEERNAGLDALITNCFNPLLLHWTTLRTAFATDDHPMDIGQVKMQGPNQRLT
jgi:hypothetical protein